MTKFFTSIIMVSVAVLAPVFAQAEEYRIDIDNIDNVSFDVEGQTVSAVASDDMYIVDTGSNRNLRVIANEGVLFTLVEEEDTYYNETNDITYKVDLLGDGRQYIDISSYYPEDIIFHIRTSGSSDARTSTCTVVIDDPDRAIVSLKGAPVTLTAGTNEVKFNPSTESELTIEPVGKPLYSVMKGDEVITTDYRYTIEIADGDVVSITSAYPDTDCPITFTLSGNGVSDFIKGVDVDGRPVFNWTDNNFSVKCGTELTLYGNLNEYEVLSFTVNGHSEMFTDKTPLFITEPTEIAISVRKYASFVITLDIDSPENLHVYRGHVGNNDEYTLEAGKNEVEVTRNTPIISIVPAEGYYIHSINVSGDEWDVEDLQIAPIRIGSLTDNDEISITTGKIVRDLTAMVYMENSAAADGFFKALRADQSVIEGLADGYNKLPFYERDNHFRFETGGPAEAFVYVNDDAIEPAPGGYNYCPTLADGDVIKFYFGEAPARHSVTVNATESASALFSIVRDHITTVDEPSSFTALQNTHIAVVPADGASLKVTLDGSALTKNDEGNFEFSAVADHEVSIENDSEDAISEIEAAQTGNAPVYDLRGVRLNGSLTTLPAGIYISNGRKIIKK